MTRLDEPAPVKRDILFLHCQDGHAWRLVGGRACDCPDALGYCSFPVYRCSACGDYDYGDNDEARQIEADCAAERAEEGEMA